MPRYRAYETTAFAIRGHAVTGESALSPPPEVWAIHVIAADERDSAKNGAFSRTRRTAQLAVDVGGTGRRFNGQRSSSKSRTGVVTTIGFASRPRANHVSDATYRCQRDVR